MATFGRLLLLVALVLLASGCAKISGTEGSGESGNNGSTDSEEGYVATLAPETWWNGGWEFHVAYGDQCLAFSHGWPDDNGMWEVYLFDTPKPPSNARASAKSIFFLVPRSATVEHLDDSGLPPELAGPAKEAEVLARMIIANSSIRNTRLDDKESAALHAVFEGRMLVSQILLPVYVIERRKLYRGNIVYEVTEANSESGGYSGVSIVPLPSGFLVFWGSERGGYAAFYFDGDKLTEYIQEGNRGDMSADEKRAAAADSVSYLARLGEASGLFDEAQSNLLLSESRVLRSESLSATKTRSWSSLCDLFEQVTRGFGALPLMSIRGEQEPLYPPTTSIQAGNVELDFTERAYKSEWELTLRSGSVSVALTGKGNGTIVVNLNDWLGGLGWMSVALTDVRLSEPESSEPGHAAKVMAEMAAQVLQSAEAKRKLNPACLGALTDLTDRKVSILSDIRSVVSFVQEVSAGGDEMLYFFTVPRERAGHAHCRATSRVATLDFTTSPVYVGPNPEIIRQVRLEGGKLGLITTEGAADARIGGEVKQAAASVGRMMEAGLSHVPDFAADTLKAFVDAVASRTEYDYVTEKSLGEIKRLSVGAAKAS